MLCPLRIQAIQGAINQIPANQSAVACVLSTWASILTVSGSRYMRECDPPCAGARALLGALLIDTSNLRCIYDFFSF